MTWLEFWKRVENYALGRLAKPAGAGPLSISIVQPLGSGYDRDAEERANRQAICDWALQQVGERYELGIESPFTGDPDVWDCSELTEHAYRRLGLSLPDGSFAQYDVCRPVREPKPADLGFLWNDKWGRIGHVEIYLGNGQVLGAVGGRVGAVRVADRSALESSPRFRGWRRHSDFAWPVEERG